MRRVGLPFASAAVLVAACNALTGASDLTPCESCEDDAGAAADAADDQSSRPVDATTSDVADDETEDGAPDSGVDSGVDAGIGCQGAADCERVVFVTSVEYGGTLGGVIGADAKCQALANAATETRVHGRTFVAWVSTSATSASVRLTHGTKPYVRSDGAVIANDWADLTKGSIDNGISIDELGMNRNGSSAWTGTESVGATYSGNACSDWTSSLGGAGGFKGERGNVGGTGGGWSGSLPDDCSNTRRLYCFEQ